MLVLEHNMNWFLWATEEGILLLLLLLFIRRFTCTHICTETKTKSCNIIHKVMFINLKINVYSL